VSDRARPWERFWFTPAPVLDLAVARWLVVGVQQVVLLRPHTLLTLPPYTRFEEKLALPAERFDPAWIFRLLTWPLGSDYRPELAHLEGVYAATIAVGFGALLGLFTRTSLALYVAGLAFLVSHNYGYGEYHHIEVMPVIALGLLACAPSGAALSLDAWWRGRRERLPPVAERTDALARWPGRLMACVFSVAYVSAGLHKLLGGGLDWLNGYTLQAYMLQDALYWNLELGVWLGQQHTLVWLLGWFTILFELSFPVVVFRPRWALPWVLAGCAFHLGIWFTMKAPFMLWLPAYALLLPWTAWWRRWRGGPAAA